MYLVQDAVKIMAKDLVRTRRYVKKFIMMRANIQAVSLKVQVSHHCACGKKYHSTPVKQPPTVKWIHVVVTFWRLVKTIEKSLLEF